MDNPRKSFLQLVSSAALFAAILSLYYGVFVGDLGLWAAFTAMTFLAVAANLHLRDAYNAPPDASHAVKPLDVTYMDTPINALPMGEHVYVIHDVSNSGYFKIGRTNNLRRRLTRFEVTLPIDMKLVHIIPCQNSISAESFLHRQFALKRKSGEWFELAQSDVQLIQSIKSM